MMVLAFDCYNKGIKLMLAYTINGPSDLSLALLVQDDVVTFAYTKFS
jgi:hypothetical protein